MAVLTHYQTLGIEFTATTAQVRRAYRDKARSLHPDVNKSPDAAERFAEVSQAYGVLSDRALRAEYDALLASPNRPDKGRGRTGTGPRYTWSNIATEQTRASKSASADFDEMYDAYFGSHRPAE